MHREVSGPIPSQVPPIPTPPFHPTLPSSPMLTQTPVLCCRDHRQVAGRKETNSTQRAIYSPWQHRSTTQHRHHYLSSRCHLASGSCGGWCPDHPLIARVAQPRPRCQGHSPLSPPWPFTGSPAAGHLCFCLNRPT